jgi:hypothetical protein
MDFFSQVLVMKSQQDTLSVNSSHSATWVKMTHKLLVADLCIIVFKRGQKSKRNTGKNKNVVTFSKSNRGAAKIIVTGKQLKVRPGALFGTMTYLSPINVCTEENVIKGKQKRRKKMLANLILNSILQVPDNLLLKFSLHWILQ